ncbi:membrane protein insertase YidC [Pseudonocardia oroxyli]|uniref:Membrane protein insertase YidC n=1 Tax=Pseudonocardia oroxyli TaxID=366584 RepID=A0A1G7K373_PSEOR|nr:membrane protein insertase YidC [Pseudonocardia oroxyli]SDF31209.1 YidC/Oxa1 family membrane protein insertase [Pseudonocardia oroxyli]
MLDFLYYPVSAVLWFWHQVFGLVLGPDDGVAWALAVIFLVLTLRTPMIKPALSRLRSAHRMRALAPRLTELRARHRDDPQKLVAETRALQAEHGVSAFGGVASALLQAPVFLALLHVLRYFNRPGLTFEQNAAIPNYVFGPDEVRSFLEARLFGAPLSAYVTMPQSLLDSFGGASVTSWQVLAVALPLAVLAAVATHVTARRSLRTQPDAPRIMRALPWVFPLGALASVPFLPDAVLVYWLANNGWTLVEQHVLGRIVEREVVVVPDAVAPRPAARAPKPGQKPVRRRS